MRRGGIGYIENLNDLGMFLAKDRRFESRILNNIFFFALVKTVLCNLWQEINTFNSRIFMCYLVLLIRFSNVK